LEVLLGAHYHLAKQVMIGAAGGLGLLHQPGTPDGRFLLRVAYAPLMRHGRKHAAAPQSGPPADRDRDGVPDPQDQCLDLAAGEHPDPARPGCPLADSDGDGVFDNEDRCPTVPAGSHPDPQRKGCPAGDQDNDGVVDTEDQCPSMAAGPHADPQRPGCPVADSDGDGVLDNEDQCPSVPAGPHADPARKGCPLPDRDGDGIADGQDACPDKPGIASADPKRNGCPALVEVTQGELKINQEVFFVTFQAKILPESAAVLQAVAQTLRDNPQIKRVEVQGHTDKNGSAKRNLDLSQRRASHVMQFLVDNGVARGRLVAKGYGDTRPIADNNTPAGRDQNRRVQFVILDPKDAGQPKN
jgi:outer membrane protein OmpA-like peptidoglycan-associated protein